MKKPRKKFLLNSKSAISFHKPDLDESKVSQEVEQQSQATYTANASRVLSTGPRGPGRAATRGVN